MGYNGKNIRDFSTEPASGIRLKEKNTDRDIWKDPDGYVNDS
jgi:hypothetical protein